MTAGVGRRAGRLLLVLPALVGGLLLAACDGGTATPGGDGFPSPVPMERTPDPFGTPPPFSPGVLPGVSPEAPFVPPTRLQLTARNTLFDREQLSAPAGSQVQLDFTNLDDVQHNFALYEDMSMNNVIFSGPMITGPSTRRTVTFTAPETPGEYAFFCEIHPDQMNGTFLVE